MKKKTTLKKSKNDSWQKRFLKTYLSSSSSCSPARVKKGDLTYCYPKKELELVKQKFPECNDDPKCLQKKQKSDFSLTALNKYLKPEQPKNWKTSAENMKLIKDQDIWLSNWELDDVMNQFEESHPNFKYVHALPIDFRKIKPNGKCVDKTMCSFQIKDYYPSKDLFGFIFNLDDSNSPGSHWISSMIDLRQKCKPRFFFYCSYASSSPREVKAFSLEIDLQLKELGFGPLKFIRNKKRHQYSNTECGMFCLHLLYQLINNESFKNICNSKINDELMLDYRNKFFHTSS